MGIINYYNNYFKSTPVISLPDPANLIIIDGSYYWYNFNEYAQQYTNKFVDNIQHSFINYIMEDVLKLEIKNEDVKIRLLFDNPMARKFSKWFKNIDRYISTQRYKKIIETYNLDEMRKYYDEGYGNWLNCSFEIKEAEYDADLDLVDYLYHKHSDFHTRTIILKDIGEFQCSNVIIYSGDSDFASYFPLCNYVCIFNYTKELSFKNHALNYDNEFIKLIYRYRDAIDWDDYYTFDIFLIHCMSIIGMCTSNDYLTCNFLDYKCFRACLNCFTSSYDKLEELDVAELRINLVCLYFNIYFNEIFLTKSYSKIRPIIQNTIRWFILDTSSEFSFVHDRKLFTKFDFNPSQERKLLSNLETHKKITLVDFNIMFKKKLDYFLLRHKDFKMYEKNFKVLINEKNIQTYAMFTLISDILSKIKIVHALENKDYVNLIKEVNVINKTTMSVNQIKTLTYEQIRDWVNDNVSGGKNDEEFMIFLSNFKKIFAIFIINLMNLWFFFKKKNLQNIEFKKLLWNIKKNHFASSTKDDEFDDFIINYMNLYFD